MSVKNKCKYCKRQELPEGVVWIGKTKQLCSACLEMRQAKENKAQLERDRAWAEKLKNLRPLAKAVNLAMDIPLFDTYEDLTEKELGDLVSAEDMDAMHDALDRAKEVN